jgi:hypothetical protein
MQPKPGLANRREGCVFPTREQSGYFRFFRPQFSRDSSAAPVYLYIGSLCADSSLGITLFTTAKLFDIFTLHISRLFMPLCKRLLRYSVVEAVGRRRTRLNPIVYYDVCISSLL